VIFASKIEGKTKYRNIVLVNGGGAFQLPWKKMQPNRIKDYPGNRENVFVQDDRPIRPFLKINRVWDIALEMSYVQNHDDMFFRSWDILFTDKYIDT